VTFSTGEKIAPPKFFRAQQTKIKRAHRSVSRTKKHSKNRGKARRRLSSVYEKVRHRRQEFLHQLSHRLLGEHDVICLEDLHLAALAKTKLRGHSKSWLDAAQGEFRRQLEYKAEWRSKRIVRIDRFFPSSQLCSHCGHREKHALSVREFTCSVCGIQHDRDHNAAKNILAEGLTLLSAGTAAAMPVEEHIRPDRQAGSSEAGKVPVSTTGSRLL
jgi:putative transposase